MNRLSLSSIGRTAAWPLAMLLCSPAGAQQAPPEQPPPAEEPAAEEPAAEEPPGSEPAAEAAPAAAPAAPAAAPRDPSQRYKDIMVVPYRSFLKSGRVELAPSAGLNINDNLISDFAVGGEANYFLSEVFPIGVLFAYFPTPGDSDLERDIRRRYHKFPTHNEYVFAAMGNVGYLPIYGKFTFFGAKVIHWDSFVAIGGGVMQTKTVPRDASNDPLVNTNPAFNAAFGGRFYLTRWLSANFSIRDFILIDKFEVDEQRNTESRLVNNVILSLGVGVYFPMGFKYTTLR